MAGLKKLKTKNDRQFIPSTSLLEQNTATIPFFVAISKHNPYSSIIKEKIEDMITNGLIEKWYNEMRSIVRDEKTIEEDSEPEVLSVEDLKLEFLAIVIVATLSCFVFIIELLLKALKLPESFDRLKKSIGSRKKSVKKRQKPRKSRTKRRQQVHVKIVKPK
jgi:hypothetical protein